MTRKFKKGRCARYGAKTRRASPARQRLILEYWDGMRQVKADPLKLQRDLLSADENLEQDIKLLQIEASNPKIAADQNKAIERVLDATRKAFSIKQLTEGGLTDLECIEVLGQWSEFMEEIKKKLGNSPTSPAPTGSPTVPLPTPNGAAYGGTVIESRPAEPLPSPPESDSHSEQNCQVVSSTP